MSALLVITSAALIVLGQGFAPRLATPLPRTAHVVPECPPELPGTRHRVIKFVRSPGLASDRAEIGLRNPDTAAIRVFADSTDAAVCQWLNANVGFSGPLLSRTYFEVNGFYVVAAANQRELTTRFTPMAVFDSTMTLRKAVAM